MTDAELAHRRAQRKRCKALRNSRTPNRYRHRDWRAVHTARQGNCCAICGGVMAPAYRGEPGPISEDSAVLDHIVPISAGGEDTFANTQATHRRCDNLKGSNR